MKNMSLLYRNIGRRSLMRCLYGTSVFDLMFGFIWARTLWCGSMLFLDFLSSFRLFSFGLCLGAWIGLSACLKTIGVGVES